MPPRVATDCPEGLDTALSLVRAAMDEAAKRRVAPNVAVWALVLEAVGRLTELHGAQAAAEFFASLEMELRKPEGLGGSNGVVN